MKNPRTRFKCNNPNCTFEVIERWPNVPDSDCPECKWHDSVIEVEDLPDEN